jgi:hypothetical protein
MMGSIILSILTIVVSSSILLDMDAYVYAHQLFNSGEYRIAGYLIQVATQPEMPAIDSTATILIRVADSDGNDIKDVNVGLRLYKNDQLYYTHPITVLKDGHLEINYVFREPGVYVTEVSVYEHDGDVVTAKFNLGIVKEFAYIFISMVILGVAMPAAIGIGVMMYRKKMKNRLSQGY